MTPDSNKTNSVETLLDANADALDSATLSKLHQARQRALAPRTKFGTAWWIPASAATAASIVAVMAFWLGVVAPQARVNTLEDLEMLAANENTELYEQLDFYDWLESQQQRNTIDAG